MEFEQVYQQIQKRASLSEPIGATIKIEIDNQSLFIDGTGSENIISQTDKEADCMVVTTMKTLQKLSSGSLKPMMAIMGGKIKIKGDMGLAMKLQNLLG